MNRIRIALVVLLALLTLLFVACTAPEPECPPHTDEDNDYVCDKCRDEIEPELPSVDLSKIRLGDAVFAYDGTERSIAIKGELPDGVSVKYSGNGVTDAGTYTVTASFYYNLDGRDFHINGKDLTATIKINKASYDLSHLIYPDLSVFADGSEYTPEVIGELPDGVEISYVGGAKSEPGSYTVRAEMVVDEKNYNVPDALTATLNIVEAEEGLGGVSVSDFYVLCDGTVKLPQYEGTLGDGWSLSRYEGETAEPRLPGEYKVSLVFANGTDEYTLSARVIIELDVLTATDGLVYDAVTGGLAVVGYNGTDSIVVIPTTADKKNVVSIASGAFMNSTVTVVYIPDSVTNIGNNAFRGSTSLEYIRIGDNVKVVGSAAFRDTAITEIYLPESLEAIGYGALEGTPMKKISIPFIGGSHKTSNPYLGYIFGADGYGGNSLFVPETLTEVVLLDSCTEIAPRAFYDCTSLEVVKIGRGVKKIGSQAFAYTAIESIFIPENVTEIPAASSDVSVSPFYGVTESLVIMLEAESVPDGYGACWNVVAVSGNNKVLATVLLGSDGTAEQ